MTPTGAASDVAAGTDAKLAQLKQNEGAAEREGAVGEILYTAETKVQPERRGATTETRCSRQDNLPNLKPDAEDKDEGEGRLPVLRRKLNSEMCTKTSTENLPKGGRNRSKSL